MALIERGQYPNMSRFHRTAEECELEAGIAEERRKRRFAGRIDVTATGLPSGGFYVSCDGVALHSKQGHRHRRIFQSEYRARRAGREYLAVRERDEEAARLAQRRANQGGMACTTIVKS